MQKPRKNNHLVSHLAGASMGLLLTWVLGTLYSCSVYNHLSRSPSVLLRGFAESFKNLFNNAGVCHYTVDNNPPQFPPSKEDIQKAIAKLQTMSPNDRLEFPVDAEVLKLEGEYNYRVIGFRVNESYLGLNAHNVKALLQEGLGHNGKFSETNTIRLIVRNQATNQRLITRPIGKNHPMDLFVPALNRGRFFVLTESPQNKI